MRPQHYAKQIDLFDHVAGAYAQPESGPLRNAELYRMTVSRAQISKEHLNETLPIGKACSERSPIKQRIRWHQQELARLGLLQKVEGQRGVWELTETGKAKLRKARPDVAVLAFSTNLGVAIWGNCTKAFGDWNEPIFLGLSSPPFPLSRPRDYGNPPIEEYIKFICRTIAPLVRNLVKGGNLVLNLGDVFDRHSPAKSTYIEELTLALKAEFGLSLMNRIVWQSNKPPGPTQWASLKRTQLNEAYEFCLWFCNDPVACIANNQRVLEPHTAKHKKLIAKGGENRFSVNGDGAYRIKPGSYGRQTEGKLARNIFSVSNHCSSQRAYKKRARELGLATHGATMPLNLARKLVRFLTDVGQLVVDPFGGSMTTPLACELENREWAASEIVYDYVRGGAERFVDCPGFELAIDAL